MPRNFVLRQHDSIASTSSIVKSFTRDDLRQMLIENNAHHLSAYYCADQPTPTTSTARRSSGPFASDPQNNTFPCSSHRSFQKKRTDLLAGFVLSSGAPGSSIFMSVDPCDDITFNNCKSNSHHRDSHVTLDGNGRATKGVSLMIKGSMFNPSYSRAHAFSFSVPRRVDGGSGEDVLPAKTTSFLWERALTHFIAAFPSSFEASVIGEERVSIKGVEEESERRRQRHLSYRESRDVPALQGLFITSTHQETVITTVVVSEQPTPPPHPPCLTTFTIGIITATDEESAADIALKWFSAVNNDYCRWLDELDQQQHDYYCEEEGDQREKQQPVLFGCSSSCKNNNDNNNSYHQYCGNGNNDRTGDLCASPHLSPSTCCDPTIYDESSSHHRRYHDYANKNGDRRSSSTSYSYYGLSSGNTTTSTTSTSTRTSGKVAVVIMSAADDDIIGDGVSPSNTKTTFANDGKKCARSPRDENYLARSHSSSSPPHQRTDDGVSIASCSSRKKLPTSSHPQPSSHSQDGGGYASRPTSFEPCPSSLKNSHSPSQGYMYFVDQAHHAPSPSPPRPNSRAPSLAHKILRSSLGSDSTKPFFSTHTCKSIGICDSVSAAPPRPKLPSSFSSAATAAVAAYQGCCLALAPPAVCGVGEVVRRIDDDDECGNRLTGLERGDNSLFFASPLRGECGDEEDERRGNCKQTNKEEGFDERRDTTPTKRNFLFEACYQKTTFPRSPPPAHQSPNSSHIHRDIDSSSSAQVRSPEPKNSGSNQHVLLLSSTRAYKCGSSSSDNRYSADYGEEAYSDVEEGPDDLTGVEAYLGRSGLVGEEQEQVDDDGRPLLIATVTREPRRERSRAPSQQQQHSFSPLLAATDEPLCTPDQKQVSGGSLHYNPNLSLLIPKTKGPPQRRKEILATCTAAAAHRSDDDPREKALPLPPPPLYLRTDLELPFCTAFNFHPISSSIKLRGVHSPSAGPTATTTTAAAVDHADYNTSSAPKKASTYAERSSVKLKLFWEPNSERVSTNRPIAPIHVFLTGGAKRRQEHTTRAKAVASHFRRDMASWPQKEEAVHVRMTGDKSWNQTIGDTDVGHEAAKATSANQLFQDPVLKIVRPVASSFVRYPCVNCDASRGPSRTLGVGASFVPRRVNTFSEAARAQFRTSVQPCASGASNNTWSMPNNTLSHFMADDIGVDAEGEHVIAAVAEPTEDYAPFVPCLVSMLPAFLVVNDD